MLMKFWFDNSAQATAFQDKVLENDGGAVSGIFGPEYQAMMIGALPKRMEEHKNLAAQMGCTKLEPMEKSC